MNAPMQPLVEQVADAIRKKAIAEWEDVAGVTVIEGYPDDLAKAAITACHADEALELLRLMRREYGGHLTVCGKTLVAVDDLLAKVEENGV